MPLPRDGVESRSTLTFPADSKRILGRIHTERCRLVPISRALGLEISGADAILQEQSTIAVAVNPEPKTVIIVLLHTAALLVGEWVESAAYRTTAGDRLVWHAIGVLIEDTKGVLERIRLWAGEFDSARVKGLDSAGSRERDRCRSCHRDCVIFGQTLDLGWVKGWKKYSQSG